MQLQFKNEHIYFAIESIWPMLDYRFKYNLHQLCIANPDDAYMQTLDVPEEILIEIFRAVSAQPEGVANQLNITMEDALLPQLMAAHNLQIILVENRPVFIPDPNEEPNEAGRILLGIQDIKIANRATREAKILNGKTQILQ